MNGPRYYVAMLGMKGDMEYHHRMTKLLRSYMNVGTTNFVPCCHLCDAGSFQIPFEDYTPDAAWISTMYQTVPWTTTPAFASIPFENWRSGAAPGWCKGDPFHVLRLGIARFFPPFASALLLAAFAGLFDVAGEGAALPLRLERAWSYFQLWCMAHSQTVNGIRSFSKEKLRFATVNSFP